MNKRVLLKRLLREPTFQGALGDLPWRERLKRFPPFLGPRHALYVLLRYDQEISLVSAEEGIQKSAVQAVIFRETLGYGIEDLLFDRLRRDASRGLCQIRPSTARKADAALGFPLKTEQEYKKALDQRRDNIRFCARILRAEAESIHAYPLQLSDTELSELFLRYNGGSHYAVCTLSYCRAIERCWNEAVSDMAAGEEGRIDPSI